MKRNECAIDPELLHCCLYFTANTLARGISGMAEEEFAKTGLSPTHGFLVMLVNSRPGITPKELAERLHLAPSTVTRLIDLVETKGLVRRESEGRTMLVYATEAGRSLQKTILECWEGLSNRYSEILGRQQGEKLTRMIDEAARKIGGGKR